VGWVAGVDLETASISGWWLAAIGALAIAVLSDLISAAIQKQAPRLLRVIRTPLRSLRLGTRLSSAGITEYWTSEQQLPGPLLDYLGRADRSIEIIAFSLRTADMRGLRPTLERLLVNSDDFSLTIGLVRPDTAAFNVVAATWNVSPDSLRSDIEHVLDHLRELYEALSRSAQDRFRVVLHESPLASAILIDADRPSGRIHVDFKLFDAPREARFGYDVVAGTELYKQNLKSFRAVLNAESTQVVIP
jgi:hypothetical protein